MRYLFLFLILSASFWACQPEEACISSATNRVVVDFFVDTARVPNLVTRERDTLGLHLVQSQTADSLFINSLTDIPTTRLLLRLDPDKDSTVFYFRGTFNKEAFQDTLVVRYQRRYRLISPDCPLEVSFQQLQVARTSFDSVQVINTELREPSDNTDIQIIRPQLK